MKFKATKKGFFLINKAYQGFTLIELLVVITISLVVMSTAIVGYRKFADRRAVADSLKIIKDQLRLVRSKAIHGEKPTFIGVPGNECTRLLYYQVDIEVVEDGDDKIAWAPFCEEAGGGIVSGIQEEYEVSTVDLVPDTELWPINIIALEGTVSRRATVGVFYKGNSGLVTISASGNIE